MIQPVTSEDVRSIVVYAADQLRPLLEADWNVVANDLEMTCWETIEHVSDCLFAYSTQISGTIAGGIPLVDSYAPIGYVTRREGGPSLTVWVEPTSGNTGQLQVLAATGGLLVAVVAMCEASALGWHSSGLADSTGFAAMGIVETLGHLHDVVTTLNGTRLAPPGEICQRVLHRLFPEIASEQLGAGDDVWPTLLYAIGRTPLGDLPRREGWKWDSIVR
jgi:hypothetical protein